MTLLAWYVHLRSGVYWSVMGTFLGKQDDPLQEHSPNVFFRDIQGDGSQIAGSSSLLPARQLHSTLRLNSPSTRSCHAQGVPHLSSFWVEFPCSPTQICVTCFIPCLQLVETAATICISHASLFSPSLVYTHYHQIILFFNWKENLQMTSQQLSSAGKRSITTCLHFKLDTWNHFTYFTVLAFLLSSWKLLYGSFIM